MPLSSPVRTPSSSILTVESAASSASPSSSSMTNPSSKDLTTSENVSKVIKAVLSILSYQAMKLLIELEVKFPAVGTDSFSSDRLDFFAGIINVACNTSYTKTSICAAHNAIMIDDHVKHELLRVTDLEKLIVQYKATNSISHVHNHRNMINIMPFTTSCTRSGCDQRILDISFSKNCNVVFLASIKSCSIFLGTCSNCQYIYGPTSLLDQRGNRRIVTPQSIQNNYIYFSGDLVFAQQVFTMFSNSLIHAHTTFEGFAEAYLATLADIHIGQQSLYSSNTFAKRLQLVWTYYEMSRFVFVASMETTFVFPRSSRPKPKMIFIEQSLPFLNHIFTGFWSRHNQFANKKCKDTCSRVMLIDGHQKSRRIVCSFENVTGTIHPEMGPILQGCPYPPKRITNTKEQTVFVFKEKSHNYCHYHKTFISDIENNHRIRTNEHEKASAIDEAIIRDLNNEEMCNVYRNELENDRKTRSFGYFVTFLSCKVLIGFSESIRSEGCRRVTAHLLTLAKTGALFPNVLVYDNACALRLHWNNVYGTEYLQQNEATQQLFNLKLLIDRFHQKGHTRPMCQKLMNANHGDNAIIMKYINTSVCEQFFSFLTKFRFSLRGFNYPTSSLFTLLLFHLKNCHTIGINANAFGLARKHFPSHIKPYFVSACVFDSVAAHRDQSNDNDGDDDEGEDQEITADNDVNDYDQEGMEIDAASPSYDDSDKEQHNHL